MAGALEQWIIKLQRMPLPALRQSVEELRLLAVNDNVAIERLSRVVERDPGLTLHLLRRCGSQRHRYLGNGVSTIPHGLMLLGLTQVRQLTTSVPLEDKLPSSKRLVLRRHYSRAYHAAVQARKLAQLLRDFQPDEVFVATLLYSFTEMLLRLYLPKKLDEAEQLARQRRIVLAEAQYVILGFAISTLTRKMCDRWQLPKLLEESLDPANAWRQRIYVIMLTQQIARTAEQSWYSQEMSGLIAQCADLLGCDFGTAANHLHQQAVVAGHSSTLLRIAPAASRLLLPSVPEADPTWQPTPTITETTTETDEHIAAVAAQSHQAATTEQHEEADGHFCLAPRRRLFQNASKQLDAIDASHTINETIDVAMQGMHHGLGLNRVVFALLTPERNQLRARAILGAEDDTLFNRFQPTVTEDNLFGKILQKPKPIWVTSRDITRYSCFMSSDFRDLIGVENFFLMGVFVNNRSIGVCYADRHHDDCQLDKDSFRRFQQLVYQLGNALGRHSNPPATNRKGR